MNADMPLTALATAKTRRWLHSRCRAHMATGSFQTSILAIAGLCDAISPCQPSEIAQRWKAAPALQWGRADLVTDLLALEQALSAGGASRQNAIAYREQLADLTHEAAGSNRILLNVVLHGDDLVVLREKAEHLVISHGEFDDLASLLTRIECATAFGLVSRQIDQTFLLLLEGAAMAALRNYDLPLAMRLLRACRYGRSDNTSLGLRAGLEFIRLAQRNEGTFGDFDTAMAQMSHERRDSCELTIYLPVTCQALWTMAELESKSFRLARHLQQKDRKRVEDANGITTSNI